MTEPVFYNIIKMAIVFSVFATRNYWDDRLNNGHRRDLMKKLFFSIPILLSLIFGLTGCNPIGDKTASFTVIYGVTAVLSLLLLMGYCCCVRKKN